MLRIFHASGTRSIRPIWLALELGLDFEIVPIEFTPEYRNSDEWRAISPAGKVPALTDDNFTLFESGAMVEYLLDQYGNGRLRPEPGTTARALYNQWCWFAEATLSRPIGLARLFRTSDNSLQEEAIAKSRDNLRAIELALTNQPFLVEGQFSAADIMTGYTLDYMDKGELLNDFPACTRYLADLRSRSAFASALAH